MSDILDKIFNSHKVKYATMELLFQDVEVHKMISRVNVFINLESIFHLFHNTMMENMVHSMDKGETAEFYVSCISNAINLAAHYRRFFTKNRIKSNIILFMCGYDEESKQNNQMYVDTYREKFIYNYTENPNYTLLNELFFSAFRSIKNVAEYIEDVHLVKSTRVESSLIPLVLLDQKVLDGQINIMVSRDTYDLQYTSKGFLVLFPKGESSVLVTKDNLFRVLRNKYEFKGDRDLPSYLLSFILAVTGDKKRNLGKLKGVSWKKVYSDLCKLFKKLDIDEDEYVGFEAVAGCIKTNPNDEDDKRQKLINNYLCIDLDRQLGMVSEPQAMEITSQLINRYEVDTLENLNSTKFALAPINVIELNQYSAKRKSLF